MGNAAGEKVWILQYVTISSNGISRPQAIPCSSEATLKKHIADIIKKNFDIFDSDHKERIQKALEIKNYDELVNQFRLAQLHNLKPIPFDLWWSGRPEVVL